jgi:hypothetical protein
MQKALPVIMNFWGVALWKSFFCNPQNVAVRQAYSVFFLLPFLRSASAPAARERKASLPLSLAMASALFTVTKKSFSFNFSKQNSDSLSLSGKLPVATGFAPGGKSMTVAIGSYVSKFTLSSHCSQSKGTDSIKLLGNMEQEICTGNTVNFSYAVKKQNLLANLQEYGFSNADAKNQPISLPVAIDLNGTGYLANITVTYNAKQGKSGSAK